MSETTRGKVRLACWECDRDDCDFITELQLAEKIAEGWESVEEQQSYEDAIKVYDDPADEPPGYSVLDWWTHIWAHALNANNGWP